MVKINDIKPFFVGDTVTVSSVMAAAQSTVMVNHTPQVILYVALIR